MTILDIVLVIELILLGTIAIVLLAALLQRDRQEQQTNPYTGFTYMYQPDYSPGAYHGQYGNGAGSVPGGIPSGPTVYEQMPGQAPCGWRPPVQAYGNGSAGQTAYGNGPAVQAVYGSAPAAERAAAFHGWTPSGQPPYRNGTAARATYGQAPSDRGRLRQRTASPVRLPSETLRKDGKSFRQQKKTIITPGVNDSSSSDRIYEQGTENGRKTTKEPVRARRWRVDFVEMNSGCRVSRDFQDHLVVGRMVNSAMESGRLYLSMDATVSRSQFCLYVSDEGIMIENLSNVNITRKNGYPVWQPVRLEEGDVLQLGRMRYMVKGIRPAA